MNEVAKKVYEMAVALAGAQAAHRVDPSPANEIALAAAHADLRAACALLPVPVPV